MCISLYPSFLFLGLVPEFVHEGHVPRPKGKISLFHPFLYFSETV